MLVPASLVSPFHLWLRKRPAPYVDDPRTAAHFSSKSSTQVPSRRADSGRFVSGNLLRSTQPEPALNTDLDLGNCHQRGE
ncbi:hypothetical protein BOTBODRAFT_409829 [Botryobasidium botryosum FD-172 SS1]|uniref:Uncharacterized protein n=1 Tax=Botryobasidium botryosum (strain FD-172 SS1) TaxID=930990 RepID=A0A067MMF1_BOTB1|nr:hypothetical protein BOTBODRAFT_409829 [Botryobasidium botryosum FD-172 SS1]